MEHPDEILMSEVKNGDLEKMAVLFERYHVRIYNFFLRMGIQKDASADLTQNLFYRMIKYRASYDETKNYKAWMYRIARNICNDYLTEQKINDEMIVLHENYSVDHINEEQAYSEEDYATLEKAMNELPSSQRELIVLCRYQGLKYHEVAAITNQSVASIKVTMFRAINKLRTIYFRQL